MKKFIPLLIITTILFSQNYEISNMRAVGYLPFDYGSDIWGYTAPDGHEFALVGRYDGTSIVDISTNPSTPIEVGFIPGASSTWRDLKVHDHYCYVTNESGGGLDIINLEDPFNPVKVGSYTATFTTAHNIYIADGYAYIFGANTSSGGCRILDLTTNPEKPREVGSWETTYFHDGYVKNDTLYGSGIYVGTLYIVDVTDKTNPFTMVEHNYSNYGCHAVWVSGDSKYAITADEESGGFIRIFDISDFSNINLLSTWYPNEPNATSKSVHNVFWKDDLLYISYYVYGTRILDMSDPSNPVEVGYYDFYPGDSGLYNGNWGTYPYTANGLIYSTDFSGDGFFVMSYPFYGDIELEILNDTEDNISSIPLGVAIVESSNYSIDYSTVKLHWGMNGTITDSAGMTADGNQYYGSLVPNGENGSMNYYVSFETTTGDRVTQPYGAPIATFSFQIGTDTELPVIHYVSDINDQFYPNGVQVVNIEATDNIAVDSVYLFWQVGNGVEQSVLCTQGINAAMYQGELTYSDVLPGTEITYWIKVIDVSSMGNSDESDPKHFSISDDYILGNFEKDLELNAWNLGTWGRQYVNADVGFALNDSPGTSYEPNSENPCDLLEPINLTYFDQAYFTFNSGEMFSNGDFGYFQVKAGMDGAWSTELMVNGFNIMKPRYVNISDFINEDELYIRLLFTSDGADESRGWFVDDIHLVLNQEMPIVGIEDNPTVPSEIVLYNAYPNPFNPFTSIQYRLPNAGKIDLKIYDLMGREVRRLVNGFTSAGTQSVVWDAKDNLGNPVSSGVYIYRLTTESKMLSKKLILLK